MNRIQRTISGFLIICLMCSFLPVHAFAYSAVLTGNQAEDIAKIALSQDGYTETPENHTKYNNWFYGYDQAAPWCAIFISWCANQAGIETSIIKKNALAGGFSTANMSSNPYGVPAFSFGSAKPQKGDIAFIDNTKNGSSDHVALVYDVDSNYIYTVEGNYSDKVCKREYSISTGKSKNNDAVIVFFGRPNYKTACKDHTKSDEKGFCINCGEKIAWTLDKTTAGIYTVIDDFTPRAEPYDQTDWMDKSFSVGSKVTVFGSLINGRGNLWYQIAWGNNQIGYVYNNQIQYSSAPITIKYDANGGSGAPSSQTKIYGTPLLLSSTKPTKSGYTFQGWSTSSTATSATYAAGGEYAVNTGTTLYAVWKPNEEIKKFDIRLNNNGGNGANSTIQVEKGKSIGTLPTPVFSGMNFVGWYTEPKGGTRVTSSTIPSGDMQLFAQYTYECRIGFDSNGGWWPGSFHVANIDGVNRGRPGETLVVFNQSGATVNTNIYGVEIAVNSSGRITAVREYGDENELTVPNGGFVLSGQAGWDESTSSHVGGCNFVWTVRDMPGDVYVGIDYETGEVFATDSYDMYLMLSKVGGTGKKIGALPTPFREGYAFDGWYTSADGGNRIESDYVVSSSMCVYAHWSEETAYLESQYESIATIIPTTSDGNYKRIVITQKGNYDGEVYLSYGWDGPIIEVIEAFGSVNANGEQQWIVNIYPKDEGSTTISFFLMDAATGLCLDTLDIPTSIWIQSYEITLDANGGTCDYESMWTKYNKPIGDLYTPTRPGYIFQGWYTSAEGGTEVTRDSIINEDTTIYAHWEKDSSKYMLTYHYGINETKSDSYEVEAGDVPVKSLPYAFGYNCLGWSTDPTVLTVDYLPYEILPITGNTTLFAVWEAAPLIPSAKDTSAVVLGSFLDPMEQGFWHKFTADETGDYVFEVFLYEEMLQMEVYDDAGNLRGMSDVGELCSMKISINAGETIYLWTTYHDSNTPSDFIMCACKIAYMYYDANGGSNAPGKQEAFVGNILNISHVVPVRNGYTFLGWSTDKNATTAQYHAGDEITMTGDVPLYAVWKCEHNYNYRLTKKPDLTTAGSMVGTCSVCSATTEAITLPKLNTTDYTYQETKAATCTETGSGKYTWKTTTYGSFSFDVVLEKLGHTYTAVVTAPNCTEKGYTTHTCSCGDSYVDTYVDATDHKWDSGKVTTAETCTKDGLKTYTCSVCKETREEVLPSKGHIYQDGLCIRCSAVDPDFADVEITITINTLAGSVSAPEGGWKEGANTFTVAAEKPCVVAVSYDGGATYTRLTASATGTNNAYSFTANDMTESSIVAVIMTGDANGDGSITNADVTRLKAAYQNKVKLDSLKWLAADVNNSGDITNADVTRLKAVYQNKTNLAW